jgi:hypothetical protein
MNLPPETLNSTDADRAMERLSLSIHAGRAGVLFDMAGGNARADLFRSFHLNPDAVNGLA